MAYTDQHAGFRTKPVVAVALVHLVIGYALVSGLATSVMQHVPSVFRVENIAEPVPPPPNPDPLPTPRAVPREIVSSPRTLVDPPRQETVVQTVLPGLPLAPLGRVDSAPQPTSQPAPPAASQAVRAQARGDRRGWITTDDYPARSLRNGEEGIVGISATIGADGRVSGCTVTASSGFPALDEATCRLYQHRARFTPARDDAGRASGSVMTDRIRWTIPR